MLLNIFFWSSIWRHHPYNVVEKKYIKILDSGTVWLKWHLQAILGAWRSWIQVKADLRQALTGKRCCRERANKVWFAFPKCRSKEARMGPGPVQLHCSGAGPELTSWTEGEAILSWSSRTFCLRWSLQGTRLQHTDFLSQHLPTAFHQRGTHTAVKLISAFKNFFNFSCILFYYLPQFEHLQPGYWYCSCPFVPNLAQ